MIFTPRNCKCPQSDNNLYGFYSYITGSTITFTMINITIFSKLTKPSMWVSFPSQIKVESIWKKQTNSLNQDAYIAYIVPWFIY